MAHKENLDINSTENLSQGSIREAEPIGGWERVMCVHEFVSGGLAYIAVKAFKPDIFT